jgi:hypothetical protein
MSFINNTSHKASFDNGVQTAWDGTSLELAQTCLRKYYYSMIRGISPKNTSVHLIFGGLYASALELYYKLRAEGQSLDEALAAVVRKTMEDSWVRPADAPGHPMIFDSTSKTRPNLIRTIVWYIEQFGNETENGMLTYHLANGKPAVELSFAIEFESDITYCGHLDRVVDYGGAHYVMDQKTTGSAPGSYFFNQFAPNNQMSGYSWAGKVILDSPVRGVIIDAAQIAVNFTEFARSITTRTARQLDEWHESALYSIRLAQSATALNKFPMNASACGNYGGCPFRILCSNDPSVRESYIKSDFKEHNWDPIKER